MSAAPTHRSFPAPSSVEAIVAAKTDASPGIAVAARWTNKQAKYAAEDIAFLIGRGAVADARALLIAFAATQSPRQDSWDRLQRTLRPSRHRDHLSRLQFVLETDSDTWTNDAKVLIEQWRRFVSLYQEAHHAILSAYSRLTRVRGWTFWTLAVAELGFDRQRRDLRPAIAYEPATDPESIAETASFILSRASKPMDFGDLARPLPSAAPPPQFATAFEQIHEARQIVTAEPLVFAWSYVCERRADGGWLIRAPSDALGKAMSYGGIRAFATANWAVRGGFPDAMSFRTLCDQLFDRFSDRLVTLPKRARRSIRFEIPEPIAKILGDELLTSEALFEEEAVALSHSSWEQSVPTERLAELELCEGLSMLDAMRMHRVLRFAAFIRAKGVDVFELDDRERVQSAVAILPRAGLEELLAAFGFSQAQAQAFSSIVTWSPGDGRLDLQYTPFVRTPSGDVVMPLYISATSNIIRNFQYTRERRVDDDGRFAGMARRLTHACGLAGIPCATNVKYTRKGGAQSDIDFCFVVGDACVVLELKNTLLPASPYETETMADHAKKASLQLRHVQEAWETRGGVRDALRDSGLPVDDTKLLPVITMSVRALSGVHFDGFPTRDLFELINFVAGGPWVVPLGEVQHEVPFYSAPISAEAVRLYLGDEPMPWSLVQRAMHHEDIAFSVGRRRVAVRHYGLDQLRLLDELVQVGLVRLEQIPSALRSALVEWQTVDRGQHAERST